MQTAASPAPTPPSPKARCILEAARTCFARHGFQGASMAAIAAEAGISVGHIYRYFAGKDAVIASLVEQDLQEITPQIESLSGRPEEIADALIRHVERLNRLGRTTLWLEILAEGARNARIAELFREASGQARESLVRSALSGGSGAQPCAADTEERLYLVGVLLHGLQVGAFADGAPPPRVLTRVRALLTDALSTPGGGADAPPDVSPRTT